MSKKPTMFSGKRKTKYAIKRGAYTALVYETFEAAEYMLSTYFDKTWKVVEV